MIESYQDHEDAELIRHELLDLAREKLSAAISSTPQEIDTVAFEIDTVAERMEEAEGTRPPNLSVDAIDVIMSETHEDPAIERTRSLIESLTDDQTEAFLQVH